MTTKELQALARAAWAESERLGYICDTCPLQDQSHAVKDWQAAFIKAAEAARQYRLSPEEAQP
jgi:hypothetical protein